MDRFHPRNLPFDNPSSRYHYQYQRMLNRCMYAALLVACFVFTDVMLAYRYCDAPPPLGARIIIDLMILFFEVVGFGITFLVLSNWGDICNGIRDWFSGY